MGTDTRETSTLLLLSAVEEPPSRFSAWAEEAGLRCLTLVDSRLATGYSDFEDLTFQESPDCLAVWAAGAEENLQRAVRLLRLEHSYIGILVITSQGAPEEEDPGFVVRAGADVVLEPEVGRDRFLFTLNRLLELGRLRTELQYLRRRDATGADLGSLVGNCPAMREVFGQVLTLCRRSSRVKLPPPVLITGETGTGKGQIARAIHHNGLRRDQAMVEVNCASLAPTLVEAELFGSERGAYTGAVTARPGLIEVAHGGSIFLDDVGSLDLEMQAKLLRFLDERRVRRLGSNRERFIDVQLVAATHRDLEAAVQLGEFRDDLYYRLSVVRMHLPALRERGDDVIELARAFLEERCSAYGIPLVSLSQASQDAMRRYHWPGNIRELRNRLERVVLLHDVKLVEPQLLELAPSGPRLSVVRGAVQVTFPPDGIDLEEVVGEIVRRAMEASDGNLSRAARMLRMSRAALRYRLGR